MKQVATIVLRRSLCFLTLLFLIRSSFAKAQTPNNKKTDTFKLQSSYPFDRSFILQHPIKKNDSIAYAHVFEVKDGCLQEIRSKKCKKKFFYDLSPTEDSLLKKRNVTEFLNNPKKSVKELLTGITEIVPDTTYEIYKINGFKNIIDTIIEKSNVLNDSLFTKKLDDFNNILNAIIEDLHSRNFDLNKIISANITIESILKSASYLKDESSSVFVEKKLSVIKRSLELKDFYSIDTAKYTGALTRLLSNKTSKADSLSALVALVKIKKMDIDNLVDKLVTSVALNVKGHDSLNAYIEMIPLEPNKKYFLVVSGAPKLDKLSKVMEYLYTGNLPEAKKLYEIISENSKVTFDLSTRNECDCNGKEFKIGAFIDFVSFYKNKIKPVAKSIADKKLQSGKIKLSLSSCTSPDVSRALAKEVIDSSQKCIYCRDTIWQFQRLNKGDSNPLNILLNIGRISDTLISYGYTDIATQNSLPGKVAADQRLKNLQKSVTDMSYLVKLLDYYNFKNPLTGYTELRKAMLVSITCLEDNYRNLNKYNSEIEEKNSSIKALQDSINHMLATYGGLALPTSGFLTNTYTWNFDARAGFAIKPDFGFMSYGDFWNDPGFLGVAPYLGFHVNLRPLDTDVPWHDIKGFSKHISFSGGALVTSLAEDGKRDGIINHTSIFTGIGYAFGHMFRITSGAVWYNKLNPNPLVNSKSIGAAPFIGISIDFRLRDIYSSFVKIF